VSALSDESGANGGGSLDSDGFGITDDAGALFDRGVALGEQSRHEEAIGAYEELISRHGEATDPELRKLVAYALRNRGFRLGMLDRHEEAIESYDELIARFGESQDTVLREQVAAALLNKGVRLKKLRRYREALAIFEEILTRYGSAADTQLRVESARARLNRADTLLRLRRIGQATRAYFQAGADFRAPEPEVRAVMSEYISLRNLRPSNSPIRDWFRRG
jgi:tetratricopeptide (TPR) repeat protein